MSLIFCQPKRRLELCASPSRPAARFRVTPFEPADDHEPVGYAFGSDRSARLPSLLIR